MAQLATASQLVSLVLGTVDRRTSAPLASQPEAKPFKDWIPQVNMCSGEDSRTPEAFLAQFHLYVRKNFVPDTERARQLIGKITGPALLWYIYDGHRGPDRLGASQAGVCWCLGPPSYIPRHCPTDAERGSAPPGPRSARGASAPVAGPFGCRARRNPLRRGPPTAEALGPALPGPGEPCPATALRYPACGAGREVRVHLNHPHCHLLSAGGGLQEAAGGEGVHGPLHHRPGRKTRRSLNAAARHSCATRAAVLICHREFRRMLRRLGAACGPGPARRLSRTPAVPTHLAAPPARRHSSVSNSTRRPFTRRR